MSVRIHGFCDKRFEPLRNAFRANFDEGLDIGASLGVTHRGKPVVDLWSGSADLAGKKPWRRNTIVQVFSTSKIMLVMCILQLVDRGKLDLDSPIARYWPEFAQGGKDKVTIRDFLIHQGGVPGFIPPVTPDELYDWRRLTAHVAAQPHRFEGRKVICYHPVTYGIVLGELIRRVDGRMPGRFFRRQFAQPAKADFQMGLSSLWDKFRLAEIRFPEEPPEHLRNAISDEIMFSSPSADADVNSRKYLFATLPSSNGYANGRSIARLCAILANGGRLGWRRYLSKQIVEEAGREQVAGEDLYIGRIRWGLGLGLDNRDWPAPAPTAFHWGGAGGSWGVMDPKSRVSLGFAPNYMFTGAGAGMDPRLARLNAALATLLPSLSD